MHQLALIQSVRKLFSSSENLELEVNEVAQQTEILQIIYKVLIFQSKDEEAYFMKIEALWILTNLAYADKENTMRLLVSSLEPECLRINASGLQIDFKNNQSMILDALNQLVLQKLDQGGKDIKTLNMIFEAIANIIPESPLIAKKVI